MAADHISWRLDQLEASVKKNTEWRERVEPKLAVSEVEFTQVKSALLKLSDDVDGLRKILITLACSIAGSSIFFGLSILVATGKVG